MPTPKKKPRVPPVAPAPDYGPRGRPALPKPPSLKKALAIDTSESTRLGRLLKFRKGGYRGRP